MSKATDTFVRIHRFRNTVAISTQDNPTTYLTTDLAFALAGAINSAAADIHNKPNFSDSLFNTITLKHLPEGITIQEEV